MKIHALSLKSLVFEGMRGHDTRQEYITSFFKNSVLSGTFRFSHVIFENLGTSQDKNLTPSTQKNN